MKADPPPGVSPEPPDPDAPRPSLAAERTDLAWDRSGLSLIACGVAMLRGLGQAGLSPGHVVAGTAVLVLGVLTWFLGAWYARRSRAHRGRRTNRADLRPTAVGVVLVGVVAFVVAAVNTG